MTIYLYVKQHSETGLKYLGKTTNNDPHKYPGSGLRWLNHLNVHGYDYTTDILRECQSDDELKEWGIYYSNLWNVVESKEWANLKSEEGQGGRLSEETRAKISVSNTGKVRSDGYKKQMSKVKKGQKYGSQSEEHKRNNALTKVGKPQPIDAIKRRSQTRSNMKWYNDGVRSFMANKCPEGCVPGRLPGLKWYNNGVRSFRRYECPEGYVPGRLG